MNERDINIQDIRNSASQQTYELREMARTLSFWMDGVHCPSEGQNLEYAVRSYLRRRIPRRFEISTGFISTLEINRQVDKEAKVTRKVSRQFDIIIWDANTFPPLYRADDFVIVVPESVKVIIEITKTLDDDKLWGDLEKFEDLYELYSSERQLFRPYTAILSFSSKLTSKSKVQMKYFLQYLEKFYLFKSTVPILFRYGVFRNQRLQVYPVALSSFLDSICILDQGLIKGKIESVGSKSVIRYIAYANEPNIETSFGVFERDIVLHLSQSAVEAAGRESSIDVYREFMNMTAQGVCGSLIIEDWEDILPSLNVMDKPSPITHQCPKGIPNCSSFIGADFADDHPRPAMYIEEYSKSNIWAFEQHSKNIFACGQYSKGSRVNWWRLFVFNEDLNKSFTHCYKIGTKSFEEAIKDIKANAWKDNQKNPR
ncbi:MAG: hypothetical protein DCE90_17005 [Pseudanabaena sp.]|nr:MAG: hypothetical protein DCE90_17005 [Pseudanabaena sp.]